MCRTYGRRTKGIIQYMNVLCTKIENILKLDSDFIIQCYTLEQFNYLLQYCKKHELIPDNILEDPFVYDEHYILNILEHYGIGVHFIDGMYKGRDGMDMYRRYQEYYKDKNIPIYSFKTLFPFTATTYTITYCSSCRNPLPKKSSTCLYCGATLL